VPRILVVDDDDTIRESLRLVLRSVGIEAVMADSGEGAIEAFDRGPFDGLIVDLMMPGMSGLETILALRARTPNLPVIIVSGSLLQGHEAPHLLRMATELRGVTSLSKPFRLAELLHEVRQRFAAVLPQQVHQPAV
jgi:CheY-like chemotaxis protein